MTHESDESNSSVPGSPVVTKLQDRLKSGGVLVLQLRRAGMYALLVRGRKSGEWMIPGGWIERSEKVVDGCFREFDEETDHTLAIIKEYPIHYTFISKNFHLQVVFVPTEFLGFEGVLGNDETSEIKWVNLRHALGGRYKLRNAL